MPEAASLPDADEGGEALFDQSEGTGLDNEDIIISNTGDVEPGSLTDTQVTMVPGEANVECPSKPEGGNQTVRARFGRKRTHNEELCVASCGMILARETFYGSESLSNVQVSNPALTVPQWLKVYSWM